MNDEINDLLEAAMYKEIAAQAMYEAAQDQTSDTGAKALLKELADDETRHLRTLKDLKEQDIEAAGWNQEEIPNLMISEHLSGGDTLKGAGIQQTLTFAMKREQEAVDFYSRMMGSRRSEEAKRLCEGLVHAELKHKLKLEMIYDDLFYQED